MYQPAQVIPPLRAPDRVRAIYVILAAVIALGAGFLIVGGMAGMCADYDGYNPEYGIDGVGSNEGIISDDDRFRYEEGTPAGHCYEGKPLARMAQGILLVSLVATMVGGLLVMRIRR